MTTTEPVRMSHSRIAGYGRCGHQYRLTRVDGVQEQPSVALAAGSAYHTWTEDYDWAHLTGIDESEPWAVYFERELAELEQQAGVPRDQFKTSGRKTKDRPNGEDIAYWMDELGPELCDRYAAFPWPEGWAIARDLPPDSSGRTTGIEYHIELLDPLWQGYVDRIFVDEAGNLVVVDLKTWQQKRVSAQLQEYMVAGQMKGMRTVYGTYYNARKGSLDGTMICGWDEQTFRDYVQLNQMGIESGLYLPVVGDHCNWCGVKENCVFAP